MKQSLLKELNQLTSYLRALNNMFSIVIPLYNKEISISNTIQSIFNQTCQNFEIIVINDGSTDSSAEIVEGLKDSRIRLINQNNQGVSAARNRGIKESKYEWILFLDGDDLWEVNHLEEIEKMMQKFPDEKVYVTSFKYSDNRKLFKHPRGKEIFLIENYFKEALNENLICTIVIVINKVCFQNIGYFNPILTRGEDMDLWARLAKQYPIVKSSKVTATYRVEAENRTSLNKDLEKAHVYYFDIDSTLDSDEKNYYKTIVLKHLYNYLRNNDLKNVSKLKRRYRSIKWRDFFKFTALTLGKKISPKKTLI